MIQNVYVLIVALSRATGVVLFGSALYAAAISFTMGGWIEIAIVRAVAGLTLIASAKLIGKFATAGLQ